MTIQRRAFIIGALGAGLAASACSTRLPDITLPPGTQLQFGPGNRFEAMLRQIEGESNGTLGVELFDVSTGHSVGINRDRRFGHCSSFKLSLAAMVLASDSLGIVDADKRVMWSEDDLMAVSPFTTRRLIEGATLRELAEATQKFSDNAAANILLREYGGPAALTAFWSGIGDNVSRLDRYEPALNNVPVAEYRDTTTPAAMARTVAALAYGEILPDEDRATLRQWMIDTPTGVRRVRAGLHEELVGGDKTGTSLWLGMESLYVDIGFVEPPADKSGDGEKWKSGPFTFATYFRPRTIVNGLDPAAEAALARVGEVLSAFAERPDRWPF
ncbi:beta-lactamase [Erythrobacter sp. NAP1]|uniref:class A beta-lactamase n=1 Tax=Erythrobacter sp. NAP1 TaxID=237727 RepID=UPI0000687617|nr:class A beta-lactamase [Erythrobacter sp. NAP1]EAQ28082.1 beta-lactamase [Erythrobacter sp. NAP1]